MTQQFTLVVYITIILLIIYCKWAGFIITKTRHLNIPAYHSSISVNMLMLYMTTLLMQINNTAAMQ